MNNTTLACIIPIVLACIGILIIVWALCKISACADEYTLHQGNDPKDWK